MKGFILGKKESMSQMFDEGGRRIPVTNITTSPCFIAGIRRKEIDGYVAIILGFGNTNIAPKSRMGAFKKAGIKTPLRFLKEMRINNDESEIIEKDGVFGIKIGEVELFPGMELTPSLFFKKDQVISVQGVSKGKGFQGVVKRHKFSGGPRTHGQSDRERAPGSIGQSTTPGRVYKGKRMAGKMGKETVTIKNLRIVDVVDNVLMVKGLVPGPRGTVITITS